MKSRVANTATMKTLKSITLPVVQCVCLTSLLIFGAPQCGHIPAWMLILPPQSPQVPRLLECCAAGEGGVADAVTGEGVFVSRTFLGMKRSVSIPQCGQMTVCPASFSSNSICPGQLLQTHLRIIIQNFFSDAVLFPRLEFGQNSGATLRL